MVIFYAQVVEVQIMLHLKWSAVRKLNCFII